MDAIYQLLIHGDSAIAWVGTFLAGLVIKYVVQRIGNEGIQLYASRAAGEVFAAVEEVYQTYVAALKAANIDGKLTNEEKAEAKSRAIGIAKSNLGKKGLERLGRILGLDSVEEWMGTRVESSVNSLKIAGKALRVRKGVPRPLPLTPTD